MRVRLSQQGSLVAAPEQTVEQIRDHLAAQQQLWAEQLTRDPGAFALLEPQIHLAFGKLADQLVASLLAHAALQQALAAAAKKKVTDAPTPLRKPQARPLTVRLLGGLVLYLSTLYCAPLARTGKGRGREGAGLYPELSVLGISEGSSPALLSTVGRQCALLPSYHLRNRSWPHAAPLWTSRLFTASHASWVPPRLPAAHATCSIGGLAEYRPARN